MVRTKKAFVALFRAIALPRIEATEAKQGGRLDNPLRAQVWNDTIDSMVKAGEMPKVALDWSNPFDLRNKP